MIRTNVLVLMLVLQSPREARADIFTDVYEGVSTVLGLRGVAKAISGGASEGVREQLNKFVDEKIDPLISRVDKIVSERIEQGVAGAKEVIKEAERALQATIVQARTQIEGLTTDFFLKLERSLDTTFARLEVTLDRVVCKLLPDGGLEVKLGPFGGSNEITVWPPAQTHCYRGFLGSQDDPEKATFRNWEYFSGELCENELKLDRISPSDSRSIEKVRKGYEKLAEMAASARCAAPDPAAKADMAERLYKYQTRAGFFRRLEKGTR